jgi:cobalt/nickel transport system permease protein
MARTFPDTWSDLDSPLHRAPAGLKCAVALGTVVAVVVTPMVHAWVFAGIAVALVGLVEISRVPASFFLKRLLLLVPIVGGIALLSALQPHGATVAISVLVRSMLSLTTMVVLTSTTRFADLLEVLRRIRVPALLVTVVALMYRYMFVLADEASRMQRAQASRTFTTRRGHAWRSRADLIARIFVRSTERAERIYVAMCARGWR